MKPNNPQQYLTTTHVDIGRQQTQYPPEEFNELVVELDELTVQDNQTIWKETARWIKYEEDFEDVHLGWGKPHSSYLSYHSLSLLIKGLESGIILLDIENESLPEIAETLANSLIEREYTTEEHKQQIVDVLLLKHKHVQEKSCKNNHFVSSDQSSHADMNIYQKYRRKQTIHELDKITKLCIQSEVCAVLVGALAVVKQFVVVFMRLKNAQNLDNLTEISLPTRFIYLLLEPLELQNECHEIGRAIAALMSNKDFQRVTYDAHTREDLLGGINDWLTKTVVIPLNEVSKEVSLPTDPEEQVVPEQKQISRTGRPFGGLIEDVRQRYSLYYSDLREGISLQCLATILFMYFAVLSPTIAFGTILDNQLDGNIGVTETLMGSGVGGIVFALLSGQPLVLIGTTGPILVVELSIYKLGKQIGMDFLVLRAWVGLWCCVICIVFTGFDGSWLINYLTRFTTEIFSFVISLIFIFESLKKIYQIFIEYPVSSVEPGNSNVALMSLVLLISSFFLAQKLKTVRNTKFLGRRIRRTLGDFGVPISIIVVSLVDYLITDITTEKLYTPSGFQLTNSSMRGWVINLGDYGKIWHILIAMLLGVVVFILISVETQITSVIMDKPERKLRKGTGYHLNLLIMGFVTLLCALFGFPFMAGGTVRSLAHVNALSVVTTNNVPGEKPTIVKIIEQRLTSLVVSVLILFSVYMGTILQFIPVPVMFGIILYIGVSSLAGTQFLSRLKLMLMPVKYHPFKPYVRYMRTLKMHVFTGIQIVCSMMLLAISVTVVSLSFPIFILFIALFRFYVIPKIFTPFELSLIDSEGPRVYREDEPDFYQEAHMPV